MKAMINVKVSFDIKAKFFPALQHSNYYDQLGWFFKLQSNSGL